MGFLVEECGAGGKDDGRVYHYVDNAEQNEKKKNRVSFSVAGRA